MTAENVFSLILLVVYVSAFGGMAWYVFIRKPTKPETQPDNRLDNPLCEEPEDAHFTSAQSIQALELLGTDGHKTAPQLAEAMGTSIQVAEAIMRHLGKSYLIQEKTLTQWDYCGGQEVTPPTFHITPLGYQALEQFE